MHDASALQSKVATIGKPVSGPVPTSCNDVQTLGWTQSGFYMVKGGNGNATKINTVYCDFTKARGATG
jgi:hypothetical protein